VKAGVAKHWKTLRLARALDCNVPEALGYLFLLWSWCSTSETHRDGGVGRYEDRDIEDALMWGGKPGELLRTLLDLRWLDAHPEPSVRIVVHDWPDHCEDYVHRALAKKCTRFANGRIPKLGGLTAPEKAKAQEAFGLVEESGTVPRTVPGTVPGRPAVAVSVAVANANGRTPPLPPSADAERGTRKALLRAQEELEAYWKALGGRPNRKDRRKLWDNLKAGHSPEQLRRSIAELVREDLGIPRDAAWPPEYSAQPP
jgi:hypothetical protein